jgi:hypothetical protein
MRLLIAAVLAVSLSAAGCEYKEESNTQTSVTNPDGSTTTVKTETKTVNGTTTGTKTETTVSRDGKMTVTQYTKKDGQWVKTP